MKKTQDQYMMELFNKLKDAGSVSFLSKWDAVRYISKGAHGAVFEAVKTDDDFSQKSAIKIIGPLRRRAIMEYKNEIDSMNSLNDCINTVHIGDCSIIELTDERTQKINYFLALRMELLEPLPEEGWTEKKVIKLGSDVCKALEYCHNCEPPIIHCDIKPSNILVDAAGNYKLADFGQARSLRNTGTTSGFHGTPSYMSPEMYNRKGYDARSDLYSLGYTMFALLNDGKVPYEELGINEAMRLKQTEKKLPRLKKASRGLQVVLERLCHFNKDERFQSAEEVLRILNASEKEQREAKSHLHTRRRFVRGLTLISMIWLGIVSAVALTTFAVKWGEALLFDREVEAVTETVLETEPEIEEENNEKKQEQAAEIFENILDYDPETYDSSEQLAKDMKQKLIDYADSLGMKYGSGAYRINQGDIQTRRDRSIGNEKVFEEVYNELVNYIGDYYTFTDVKSYTITVESNYVPYLYDPSGIGGIGYHTAYVFDIAFWSDYPQ